MHYFRHCCFNLSSLLTGLALLVLPLPLEAAEDTDALLEKGAKLLQKGEYRKSSKVFQKIDQLEGGRSPEALVGLAMSFNGWGKPREAAESARRALARTEGDLYMLALGEFVLALASDGVLKGEEIERAMTETRRMLDGEPNTWVTEQLRVRLCRSVYLQPALHRSSSGSSFTRTEPTQPQDVGTDVPPPKKIYAPSPRPSESLLPIAGRYNQAIVAAKIDRDGCVEGLEVLESTDAMWSKVVVNTVREWVFEPARVYGAPVVVLYNLVVTLREN